MILFQDLGKWSVRQFQSKFSVEILASESLLEGLPIVCSTRALTRSEEAPEQSPCASTSYPLLHPQCQPSAGREGESKYFVYGPPSVCVEKEERLNF